MRNFIISILVILMSILIGVDRLSAQVDQNKTQLPGKIYPAESMVGEWVASDKSKINVKEGEAGGQLIKKKGLDWNALSRSGHNMYKAEKDGKVLFDIKITGENELEITDRSNPESEVKSIFRRKVDGVVIGEEPSAKSKALEDKKMFISLYPSLKSPFALYVGRINKKFNLYGGISMSGVQLSGDFFEGYSNGEVYESLSGDPDNEGLSTGDEVVGQMSVAIGLSSEIIKNKLRVHYGVGFGKYEIYRGFDIWRKDGNGDWRYDKSVWARDDDSIVQGVYAEAGFMYDVGVLLSLGFGTISFQQHDIRFGVGYAF